MFGAGALGSCKLLENQQQWGEAGGGPQGKTLPGWLHKADSACAVRGRGDLEFAFCIGLLSLAAKRRTRQRSEVPSGRQKLELVC